MFYVFTFLLIAWYFFEYSKRKTGIVRSGLQENTLFSYEREWTLYHNQFSLCSKKIRACLAEYDIDYDSKHIELIETGRYENIGSEFLYVNPAATVPVLLHNGHPVYESHEQIRYLAEQIDRRNLLVPLDQEQRVLMNKWIEKSSLIGDDPIAALRETAGNAVPGLTLPIFAAMLKHVPVYRILEGLLFHRIKTRAFFFLMMKIAGLDRTVRIEPVKKIIQNSFDSMSEHLDQLEQQLGVSGGPWICGDQFTLADVGMMAILDRLREGDWVDELIDPRLNVNKYWKDIQRRPSYIQSCIKFTHPMVDIATKDIQIIKETNNDPLPK